MRITGVAWTLAVIIIILGAGWYAYSTTAAVPAEPQVLNTNDTLPVGDVTPAPSTTSATSSTTSVTASTSVIIH